MKIELQVAGCRLQVIAAARWLFPTFNLQLSTFNQLP
jgi:hypothetical protein